MKFSESEDLPKEILDVFDRMRADPSYGVTWNRAERESRRRARSLDEGDNVFVSDEN